MHLDDLETESALALLERALREEPKDRSGTEPERWERRVALRQGLALAYADLRREGAAQAVLAELRAEGAGRQGLEALRLKEAEASILQRLEADEEAAELLLQAWSGYTLANAPWAAARAPLNLAALRAEQGSKQDLDRLREGVDGLAGLSQSVREALAWGLEEAARAGPGAVVLTIPQKRRNLDLEVGTGGLEAHVSAHSE